jgi:Zn-dependent protease with chaperone function
VNSIAAWYYNGKTAQRREVMLTLLENTLYIEGPELPLSFAFSDIRVSSRLGNTPRILDFPDGGKCEVRDNDSIDQWLAARGGQSSSRLLHRLESRMGYAFAAMVFTVGILWATITLGAPAFAKLAAEKMPAQTEEALGGHVLAGLDKAFFSPSKLSEEKQQQVSATFDRINKNLQRDEPLQLEFRAGDRIGANALALPSGIVVVTDELVKLAENQEELFAVLSHEAGHVMHRHALRGWLQDSLVALIIAGVASDATSLSVLAAGLPTALVNAKYSREFETEADDFAYQKMQEQKIPLRNFANILSRLEQSAKGKPPSKDEAKPSKKTDNNQSDGDALDFMSSHPATAERIKRFQVD